MTVGQLLFGFEGRINRARFWFAELLVYVLWTALLTLAYAVDSGFMWSVVAGVVLIIIWPFVAIQVKRWHDRDKSGLWVLINLVPVIGRCGS